MKIGTGWLGWTEAQTLNTSMDVILDAYEARLEMLRWMTGKPVPKGQSVPVTPPAGTPMSSALFMAMFGKKK